MGALFMSFSAALFLGIFEDDMKVALSIFAWPSI